MSQPEDQQNQSPQSPPPQVDLGTELRELGQQIEQAVRSAFESDRAKQMQADISAGMKEIGAQLQTTVKAIQENPQVQQLVQRGEQAVGQAVGQAQQSKVGQDFQETLTRGVALLNEQLANFVTRLHQPEGSTPPAADMSSTPPVTDMGSTPPAADMGSPTMGETTRLDPDEK